MLLLVDVVDTIPLGFQPRLVRNIPEQNDLITFAKQHNIANALHITKFNDVEVSSIDFAYTRFVGDVPVMTDRGVVVALYELLPGMNPIRLLRNIDMHPTLVGYDALRSTALLLIAFVAEQLRAINGSGGLTTVLTTRRVTPKSVILFTPPTSTVRDLRCCSTSTGLLMYLKQFTIETNFGRCSCDVAAHPDVFKHIRDYFSITLKGRAELREMELSPDAFHVDHVLPLCLNGPSHVKNAYLMPGGANSHFRDNLDVAKRDYIGKKQLEAVRSLMHYMVLHVDFGSF